MSHLAYKLMDFGSATEASLQAAERPLEFRPKLPAARCETCEAIEAEAANIKADYEEKLAGQMQNLQAEFQNKIDDLQNSLDETLRLGLRQCLTALFPALAQASLREALKTEINSHLTDSLPQTLDVKVSPDVSEYIDLPPAIKVTKDKNLSGYVVEIHQGAASTRLDPDAILNRCIAILKTDKIDEGSNGRH